MRLLHNIGERINSNYNTRQEILACWDPLSFDGIYLNVYENRDILYKKDVTLFVMGNYVGKDNSFDAGQKLEHYCTWDEIKEMAEEMGMKIGFHSWSHPDLRLLNDDDLKKEVTPPFPMDYFAYPYGHVDDRVERAVREAGYKLAWTVNGGYGNDFRIPRRYLNW